MLFAIDGGMPYLISNGRAYPVTIEDGVVTVDENTSSITELVGSYSLIEIVAKFGNVSSVPKKKRSKKEEE